MGEALYILCAENRNSSLHFYLHNFLKGENMVNLYYHQKKQLQFIENKLPGKLPMAIESPTGSGKTFVILEFCKRYFEEHKGEDVTIVITTGFNKLVMQFLRDAEMFGLDPIIWMGKGAIQDAVKLQKKENLKSLPNLSDGYHGFTLNKETQLTKQFRKSSDDELRLFKQTLQKMKSLGPKLIITNHLSYLLGLKYGQFSPNVCIVDESHTFSSFYETFLRLEVTKEEIYDIQRRLKGAGPTLSLFQRAISQGRTISPQLFSLVKNKLNNTDINGEVIYRLEEYSTTKPSIDNHIDISPNGITITKFYSSYDINQTNISYILFSATQDTFTLKMFGVYKNRLYKETAVKTVDYSKSELVVIPQKDFSDSISKFLKYMDNKKANNGLILSTTLVDIRYLKSLSDIHGFTFTDNMEYFINNRITRDMSEDERKDKIDKLVLIGSRALFQGIDISALDFVAINRIPFSTYDDKFQKQSNYLKDVARMNPWTDFTLPLVTNDLIQTTGRLWRNKDDYGTIGIFDERLNSRFKYIKNYLLEVRKGIKEVDILNSSDI